MSARELKSCPPCHGDCEQGRRCPARQKDRQQRDDHFLPYYAKLRDGELVKSVPGFPWLALALAASAVFWATIIAILITG